MTNHAAPLTTETLSVTRDGHVAELRFTRPEVLNRFDNAQHADFLAAIRQLAQDAELRVLVLSAEGRVFSAGGDVEFMQDVQRDRVAQHHMIGEGLQLVRELTAFPAALVTALQGHAMGLAANVALLSDVVVASRNVTLADPHVRMGLVAGDGGCVAWPQAAGMLRARRHLLTGDPIDAETGFRLGLITDLVETPEETGPAARELAARIASLPPLAVRGTKQALNRVTQQRTGEVLELSLQLEGHTMGSADLLEATTAFKERRTGTFTGR